MKTTIGFVNKNSSSAKRVALAVALCFSSLLSVAAHGAELKPGMYQFWNSAQEQPVGPPSKSFCVSAAAAKNPVTLNGEIIGDAGCNASPLVGMSANSASFTLTCANSKIVGKATVVFEGEKATTAISWTGAALPKSFVHAQRVGVCG